MPLGERSYDVLVGHGAAEFLGTMIPDPAKRAAVVTQPGLPLEIAANIPHERFEIGRGEQHKTLETVGDLCRGFARMGLTRNDVVIGVGGGMVTDVAGFAAATYHRGVPVVHVATTLLGMVDAAIGGQDRRQPAGGQEPRRRVLAAERCGLRSRCARLRCPIARSAAGTARWRSTTS